MALWGSVSDRDGFMRSKALSAGVLALSPFDGLGFLHVLDNCGPKAIEHFTHGLGIHPEELWRMFT